MKSGFIEDLWREALNWRSSYFFRRPLLVALVCYGSVLFCLSRTGWWTRPSHQDPARWAGERVTLTGVITAAPDLTPRGAVLLLESETVRVETETFAVRGRVRVQVANLSSDRAQPGDRVMVHGRLSRPTPARVPGTFDFENYLSARGVHSVLYAGASSFHNLGNSGDHCWRRWGWKLNQHVVEMFDRRLPSEPAAILSGLVAGRRPRFHAEVKRVFTESGTMHVLVASGSNVAFVAGLWYLLARLFFRLPRRGALVSSLPAVWGYAFLAGLDAPILRAALMASLGFVAHALSREDRPIHAVAVAALVMLLLDPRLIADLGFQMSFLTVTGFLVTIPGLSAALPPAWRWRKALIQLAATAVIAQLWLLPITLSIFKRIYPLSLLANMMVVPLSGGGLFAGFVLFAFDRISSWHPVLDIVTRAVADGVSSYATALFSLARFFADHPGHVLWLASPPLTAVAGYYLACFSLPLIRKFATAKLAGALGGVLILIGCLFTPGREKTDCLQATWIDTGRSLAALIETPAGKRALVLSSTSPVTDTWEKTLMPYLAERGIHRLNVVSSPGSFSPEDKRRLEPWIRIDRWMEGSFETLTDGDLTLEAETPADSYTHVPPVIVRCSSTTILLTKGLGLRTQEELLKKNVGPTAVVQGSFSSRTKWRTDFLERLQPAWVVETGFNSKHRPSCPPWKDVALAVPQKTGIFTWRKGLRPEAVVDEKN